MNKIITLTSATKNSDQTVMKVIIFVDSIGQYWSLDDRCTAIRFKDGKIFYYVETIEDIDKMLGFYS